MGNESLRPDHLDRLRRFGVTHVRIPFGYWLLESVYDESDGFVSGAAVYLRRALVWLKQRRMRALLDLHAMPGGQAADEGFTGRRRSKAEFFLNTTNFARGKSAVLALARLALSYELDTETSGVVMGIQIINEPQHDYWNTSPGIREFDEEMIPEVRKLLPSDHYMIVVCFMDSPHSESAAWLAAARVRDPAAYAGVVYDAHLYHSFGDNTHPWSKGQDSCKTCCRDPYILEPMSSRRLPTIVGEYAMTTGFGGWDKDDFSREFLHNQLALWNTTTAVVGSFLWNYQLRLHGTYFEEWSLLDMVEQRKLLSEDEAFRLDVSTSCPAGEAVDTCENYTGRIVTWDTPCSWTGADKDGRATHMMDWPELHYRGVIRSYHGRKPPR